MALYNEERPHSFSSIIGQEKTVKVLVNDLKRGKTSGAYLFSGVRGTGKTTLARIVAESLNCEHPSEDGSPCGTCAACKAIREKNCLDVFELDAASNNSVEKMRDMLETIHYHPVYKTKIYILDECHMLSNSASNALLKALEEPPAGVVFILCTTEKHKILPTIISRCSCYDFEKISREQISGHLLNVCQKHGANIDKSALDIIAKAADGSMRDALSILDKFIALDNVDATMVADALGMAANDIVVTILEGIANENPSIASDALKAFSNRGGSLSHLIEDIFSFLLDMIDFQHTGDADAIVGTDDYKDSILNLSYKLTTDRAFIIMDEFRKVYQHTSDFSFLAAILGVISHESQISEMQRAIRSLKEEIISLKGSGVLPSISSVPKESDSAESALSSTADLSPAPSEPTVEHISQLDACGELEDGSYDSNFSYDEELPEGFSTIDTMTEFCAFDTPSIEAGDASMPTDCVANNKNATSAITDGMSLDDLMALEDDSCDEANSNESIVTNNESADIDNEESFFTDSNDFFGGFPRL